MFEPGNRSLDGPLGALICGFVGCALNPPAPTVMWRFTCAKLLVMGPPRILRLRSNSAEPWLEMAQGVIRQ